MQVLNDFKQIKIEDILPFFPDFVTIDHFKVLCWMCTEIIFICFFICLFVLRMRFVRP